MRSPFRYSRQEKRGITILLLLIATFQSILWLYDPDRGSDRSPLMTYDSIPDASLSPFSRLRNPVNDQPIRKINPNYITDYRGYLLGMSPAELDRLNAFRKEGRYVKSVKEFQEVTKISDSLLAEIGPQLSFPNIDRKERTHAVKKHGRAVIKDLNKATATELQSVSGIGPVLSSRIVRFRDRLGGFLIDEQLFDVYGLDKEVALRALNVFRVQNPPAVEMLSLNKAGEEELGELIYLGKRLARRIVAYRERIGKFDSVEQLTKIQDFPSERINRIKLYLGL